LIVFQTAVTHDAAKKIIPDEESKTDHWKKNATSSTDSETDMQENCCSCKKTSITEDDTEVERRISFEDYLINSIYVKRFDLNKSDSIFILWYINNCIICSFYRTSNESLERKKREVAESPSQQSLEISTQSDINVTQNIPTVPPPHDYFQRTVYHSKYVLIPNLSHFTEYTIQVRACHDVKLDANRDNCSLKAMTSVRTLPLGMSYQYFTIESIAKSNFFQLKGGADDIDETTISVTTENGTQSSSIVNLKWDEPLNPNGFIVSYHIEYRQVSSESVEYNFFSINSNFTYIELFQFQTFSTPVCITRDQYLKFKSGYPLLNLSPGNYSLRLRAHSLASWSNWTKPLYFVVLEPSQSNLNKI